MTAYRDGAFIEAPSRSQPAFSKDTACELAELVRSARIAGGDVPIGYKVGFTNGAVRAQFAAPAPMAAPMYRGTLGSANRIDASTLLGPRIEPEIVVGIGDDGEPAWAALGFEIVQSHVADWNFSYLDAIADFGLHAALIIGERRPLGVHGLAGLAAMRVTLRRNDDTVETGGASDVDGGPLGSIAFLRTDLARVNRTLLPGEIISTGSMTRVPPIASGERWTIEAENAELPLLTIDVI